MTAQMSPYMKKNYFVMHSCHFTRFKWTPFCKSECEHYFLSCPSLLQQCTNLDFPALQSTQAGLHTLCVHVHYSFYINSFFFSLTHIGRVECSINNSSVHTLCVFTAQMKNNSNESSLNCDICVRWKTSLFTWAAEAEPWKVPPGGSRSREEMLWR